MSFYASSIPTWPLAYYIHLTRSGHSDIHPFGITRNRNSINGYFVIETKCSRRDVIMMSNWEHGH